MGWRSQLGTTTTFFCALAALFTLAACDPGPGRIDRPNVVLISIDTLRADHLGLYGYAKNTSPAIDALAGQSVVFDAALAVHTNTAPAHASMMTGLYPGSHGLRRNGMQLDDDVAPLAEILKQRGYATAGFIGGWTLHPLTGLHRGFDTYDAELGGHNRRPAPATWEVTRRWLDDERPRDRPFFLFFHLFDPHYPYMPPPEIARRFLPEGRELRETLHEGLPGLLSELNLTEQDKLEYIARYDGEIALADRITGDLLDHLRARGLLDRTLVILTSDHGETLFERAWVLDHGGRAYDEQLHIPLIVRFPYAAHAARRVGTQVSQVDLLPTIAEFLDIPLPQAVSGVSLLPTIASADDAAPRPAFAHGRPEPGRVPEIDAALSRLGLITGLRLPNVKLIEYPTIDGGHHRQLFLLDADAGEQIDVADAHPELVERLHQQLEDFRRSTGSDTRPPLPQLAPDVEERLRALGYVE